MEQTIQQVFDLLKSSLFDYDTPIEIEDWQPVFTEMKDQAVAALPKKWIEANLPSAEPWHSYCYFQQGQWIRVMHAQDELIKLLESHNIPSVIIKGSAAAMYYPHPILRSMGDVDVLVRRSDQDRAASVLEANGYVLAADKDTVKHHYNYIKNNISIELHKRLPVIDDKDERLLSFFEAGIDEREWKTSEGYKFPVLPPVLNGLVLIFHINQHLRIALGLRQIIDWMMYVNHLSDVQWVELRMMLQRVGMEKLALTTTAMCQKYFGLKSCFSGCETIDSTVCDELIAFILEKGNFGTKAGVNGKVEEFSLSAAKKGGFFRRLQKGGLIKWMAARKYAFLRPFAWIYQSFRIIRILVKNGVSIKKVRDLYEKGLGQRKLIEALGLSMDRTIKTE